MRIFEGFKSRWTIPCECSCFKPAATSRRIRTPSLVGKPDVSKRGAESLIFVVSVARDQRGELFPSEFVELRQQTLHRDRSTVEFTVKHHRPAGTVTENRRFHD